nr:hypothetical protein [uncultured Noviherbaspirillum sp.]
MSRKKNGRSRPSKVEVHDVVIENPSGHVVTLSKWEGDLPPAYSIRLTDGLRSSVVAAIRPGLEVLSHTQAASNAFTVVFQPRVTEGLANQTMKLMKGEQGVYLTAMETVLGKNGKAMQRIAGNGQLVANNVQRVAHLSMAALQVAAVVTAQAYLAEIDKKLTTIQESVGEIRDWLEATERSRLQGNYQYLESITETIRAGNLNAAETAVYLGQIEDIERDALATANLWLSQMREVHSKLPDITQSFYSSGAKEDMAKLHHAINRWVGFANGCMAVQQVRMVALHLRSLIAADEHLGNSRLANSHSTLTDLEQLWVNFSQAARGKAAAVDSHFDKGISAIERREFVKQIDSHSAEIMTRLSEVRKFNKSIKNALQSKQMEDEAGLVLLVSTDANGSINDLKRIVLKPEAIPIL